MYSSTDPQSSVQPIISADKQHITNISSIGLDKPKTPIYFNFSNFRLGPNISRKNIIMDNSTQINNLPYNRGSPLISVDTRTNNNSSIVNGNNMVPHDHREEVVGVVIKIITSADVKKYKYLAFLKGFYRSDNASKIEDNDSNDNQGPKLKCKEVFFQLQTKNKGKIICNSVTHFPIQKHDAVFGQVKIVSVPSEYNARSGQLLNEPGVYFEFTYVPMGLAGRTKDAFYDNLIKYSYGRIKGKIATDIYNQLVYSTPNNTSSDSVMDDINQAFNELSMLSERLRRSQPHELENLFNGVNGKTCRTLLDRWYWYYLRRRIEILGVERKTIKDMIQLGYTMTNLYTIVRNDAFILLPLSLEEAVGLKKRLRQNYTPFDMEVARIARIIYNKVINDKWTCVPAVYGLGDRNSQFIKGWDSKRCFNELITKYEMIHDLDSLYFIQRYRDEKLVAERLIRAHKSLPSYDTDDIIYTNSRVASLTNEQKDAVRDVLENPISIISGAAGTGKTTIIEQVCENLKNQDKRYAIVAFTGKAVARIKGVVKSSVTPMTIHALCYGGWNNVDSETGDEKFDHVIIDEASMITISLLAMIYRSFDHDFGITLVGDIDQLEPIDWGFPYKEVLKANIFSNNILTKNLRVKRKMNASNSTFTSTSTSTSSNSSNYDPINSGILINMERISNIIEGDRQTLEGINLFNTVLKQNNYGPNNDISYLTNDKPSIPFKLVTHQTNSNDIIRPIPIHSHNSGSYMTKSIISNSFSGSTVNHLAAISKHNRDNFIFTMRHDFTITDGGYDQVRIKLEELIDLGIEPKNIVILSPYNRSLSDLNNIAQQICIVDRSNPFNSDGRIFFKHDVIVMTRNDYTVNIMNGTNGTIMFFEYILNKHRMTQVNLNQPRNTFRKRSVPEIHTGYVQIEFITRETARFLLNRFDHYIYTWCLKLIPHLTVTSTGRRHFQINSQEEWKAIITCINRSYQYYIRYPHTAAKFAASPTFNRIDVQMIFEPLTRIARHYGYMGDITHGYAMTVHKAQGSQWAHTIPYIDYTAKGGPFLNNKLLNTMLTRAEETVSCVGNPIRFRSAATQPSPVRYDCLGIRLTKLNG